MEDYFEKFIKEEYDWLYGCDDCADVIMRETEISEEEYYEHLAWFLMYLPENVVIERLFSRIPEEDSVFSNWGMSWWKCQEEFLLYMKEHDFYQGKASNEILANPIIKAGFLNQ